MNNFRRETFITYRQAFGSSCLQALKLNYSIYFLRIDISIIVPATISYLNYLLI